jgi:hypothetical protein
VNYDDAVEALFHVMPDGAPPPPPTVDARPARALRDALEPISQHSVWSRHVNVALTGIGIDFLPGIVWGRAAALGEPSAAVVAAVFGTWEPNLVMGLYDAGRRACERTRLLATRTTTTIESLAAVFDGADVAPVAAPLRRAVEAADGTGRPLFSGVRAHGWPDNPIGVLWRACEALRERRGDSHLAAYTAAGLGPLEMHTLSELWLGMPLGSHSAIYGWSPEQISDSVDRLTAKSLIADGRLTPLGREIRDGIEAQTDDLEAPVVAALADDYRTVVDALNHWSAACVKAKAYPPDPYRRAGG